MGVLQRFERRLEGMVTGAFTKAFKAEVQPVEIAAALQRELDNNAQIVTRERSLVPNDFVIELGSHDHERLAPYESTLTAELLELVREHADLQHYAFTGPVSGGVRETRRPRHGPVPGPQHGAGGCRPRIDESADRCHRARRGGIPDDQRDSASGRAAWARPWARK